MGRLLIRYWRMLRGEIVLGFLIATVFWMGVLGWQAAHAPTDTQKQKCYEAAEKSGHKIEECKTFWERSTSDPVALFTLVLAISTIGLWVATIFLYRAGEKQFRHARRSAAVQARDMQASIKAANRAADISERTLVGIERPWLFVNLHSHLGGEIGDYTIPFARFDISNHGRMPAIIEGCWITLGGGIMAPEPPLLRDEFHGAIGPNERMENRTVDCPDGREYDLMVDLGGGGNHPVPRIEGEEEFFFYIQLEYTDIEGRRHRSRFCWRYDKGLVSAVPNTMR